MIRSFTLAGLLAIPGSATSQDSATPAPESRFIEVDVTFQNGNVQLAGTLLQPEGDGPVPAVVFVNGAGRHTRRGLRTVAEHFAASGIGALIYDKRGVGESQGKYESRFPYENLVNDALAGVRLLRQQSAIGHDRIGIWGSSQGADIASIAATRSDEVSFLVAVGAPVSNGGGYHYRRNLFRRYELSDTLLDTANKSVMVQRDMEDLVSGGKLPGFFARRYPEPNEFVHHAWSHVKQPVLAMWGEFDQNVCPGESVEGLRNSLRLAGNSDWTIAVIENANHGLGRSETGRLQDTWRGYAPETLQLMTDWVQDTVDDGTKFPGKTQIGAVAPTGSMTTARRLERTRWFGNAIVQICAWAFFFVYWLWRAVTRGNSHSGECPSPAGDSNVLSLRLRGRLPRVVAYVNVVLLTASGILSLFVIDQLHPSCPAPLSFVPALGSIAAAGSVLLIVRDASGRRFVPSTLINLAYIPFLWYWNLIGISF